MIETVEEFLSLVHSDERDPYRRAVLEEAPDEVWRGLLDRHPESRYAIVFNKRLPDWVLALLARDPDARIRGLIASKRRLPDDVRESLARDPDAGVRGSVARNPKTPRHLLVELARDEDPMVRATAESRAPGSP